MAYGGSTGGEPDERRVRLGFGSVREGSMPLRWDGSDGPYAEFMAGDLELLLSRKR